MKKAGTISWYGGTGDSQDNNRPAGGIPNEKLPQIAVFNQHTLGGYWLIDAGHHKEVVYQGEIGPHPDTGRTFDFNPLAAKLFGWEATDAKFPTGRKVTGTYLGKSKVRAREVRRQIRGVPVARQAARATVAPAPRRAASTVPMLGGMTLPQIQAALTAIRAGL